MAFTFDPIFAADPSNAQNVAANAAIVIFDPADAGKAPIALTDVTGSPLANPITVNRNGFGPAFTSTLDRVAWSGGGFTGFFTSYEGIKAAAVAAQDAATNSAAAASVSAGETVATATVNGSGRLILTKANAATVDAGSVIGPAGAKGDKGADGSNVLPTDTAVKNAITTPGTETATALKSNFVPKWQPNTAYLANDKVVSPNGDVISSKLNFTSGATYNPANWDLSASYATPASVAAKAGLSDVGTSKASKVFRVACLGNSLYDGTSTSDTNVYDANPETIYTDSTWYNIAIVMSQGKLVRGGNFGIGGQNTAQVVARVPDVIAANPKPNACVMGELTNTIGGGADDAGTLAAVDQLFAGADQLAAAGIIPIIMNTPTRGNIATPKTDNERRLVALANTKIARVAALRGYPVIDVHRVSIDPTTGKYLEAASTDGVHYTKLYNRKVAEAALDVLLPMAGGYSPFLADWNADPTNLITNGLFLGTTTTVGGYPMPQGWTGGSNNQRAITAPVAADKVLGNWFDLWKDATVGAATATDYTNLSPSIAAGAGTFAVGDRMRFACRVRIEDIENAVASTGALHWAGLTVLCGGISQNIGPLYQYQVNISDGLAVAEFTVPTGTTSLAVYLGIAGQGKLRVAQMTLRNLTKLGAL